MAKIDDSVKKKVPELRFKGFTDDWEERKLGEYVNFLNGRAYKQSELLDKGKYKVVRVGNFNTNDRWYYSDLELDQNKYAQKGDLLYLWATNFGPEIWSEEKVIYHYHIWKLELLNNNLDKQYLYTWLVTDKERIKQNTNGTTMVHVTKGNMEQRDFQFPGLNEQQKIGSFFKQLDDTIALHQRKLDLLKEQKKGYLQKMFPKNGSKIPELRFNGFSGDWEERKLLDNVDKVLDYRGKSPTKFGMEWGTEGYLVLSALNVKNGYIDKSVEAKYGDQELFERWMGSNRLEKGDVLFTTEAPLGNVAQVPDDKGYILNQRAVAFKSSKDTDNNFFAQLLRSPIVQNTLNANSSGGTAKGIGMKEFAKLNAHVPKTFEEQQKIGSFFKQLDDTIALHQRKLDLLKEQKKGFLQKMFV